MNTNEQTELDETPRTDGFVMAQSQEQFYGGTEANIQNIVWEHYQKLQEHARTLERELNAATRRAAQAEKELTSANEALKLAAEVLEWSTNVLNKIFHFGEKGGAFLNGIEHAGIEIKLERNSKALSHPAIQAILKGE